MPVPTLFGAQTNWIALEANGLVRNRAGELWDTGGFTPFRLTSAATVLRRVTSNSVSDHLADRRSDWVARWDVRTARFGLTADGQLWEWGLNLGGERALSLQQRLLLMRERLSGKNVVGSSLLAFPPYSEQPRPLFQLITPPPP